MVLAKWYIIFRLYTTIQKEKLVHFPNLDCTSLYSLFFQIPDADSLTFAPDDKSFIEKENLTPDIKGPAEGAGQVICTQCGKTFARKDNLSRHMVRHSGKFNYFCEICQKGFGRKYLYDEHMIVVHEGRRFYCDYCGTGFTSKAGLHNHKKKEH